MLFTPLKSKDLDFKNRFVMSSMTRGRANGETGAITPLHKLYYSQRADSASLIVTETMPVSKLGTTWMNTPHLQTAENAQKWREVVEAVHAKHCLLFAQFYHGGRTVHPDLVGGQTPIAPSPIQLVGEAFTPDGKKPYALPREMTKQDIQQVIKEFGVSFQHAKLAGFDGVELNAASGLLLDQFVKSALNKRGDEYGGSVENRARFLLEVVDEGLKTWDAGRLGIKMSPVGRSNAQFDDNPAETLKYVLEQLQKRGLLFVELVEAEDYIKENNGAEQIANVAAEGRKTWKGNLITNGYRPLEERIRKLEAGEADFVAFGRNFISNPDLAERIKNGWPLEPTRMEYAGSGGEMGYTDYNPFTHA